LKKNASTGTAAISEANPISCKEKIVDGITLERDRILTQPKQTVQACWCKKCEYFSVASSSNVLGEIPAWVWIVGIVFLLSICTGK
jgi:hypothetical protein